MRKSFIFILTTMILGVVSCTGDAKAPQADSKWLVDNFDDIKVLRYYVDGFENLPLEQKELICYLSMASVSGRDIMFDQNFKYNLAIRRTLEAVYENYEGDKSGADWAAFEKYLKKIWFANGIHHHYSNDKFRPEFSRESFDKWVAAVPQDKFPQDFGTFEELISTVSEAIFNDELYKTKLNSIDGEDLLLTSAMNYYEGVSQQEANEFYDSMVDPKDQTPVSYGLNSKLVKENGKLVEKVYRVGGMYSAAIEQIVYWLDKAAGVAEGAQKEYIEKLISYYKTGDLKEFDEFNIMWVQDTDCFVDFEGFFQVTGDPVGHGVFRTAAEEYAGNTQSKSYTASFAFFFSPITAVRTRYIGYWGHYEQSGGNKRKRGKEQGKVYPIVAAENIEEHGADQNNKQNAKSIKRVEKAHILLRIL